MNLITFRLHKRDKEEADRNAEGILAFRLIRIEVCNSRRLFWRHNFWVDDDAVLVFGDAFLVWDNFHFVFFLLGLSSFLISHIYYVRSFGLKPFKPGIAGGIFLCSALVFSTCVYFERNSEKPLDDNVFYITGISFFLQL